MAPKCKTVSVSRVQLRKQQSIPNKEEIESVLDLNLPSVATLEQFKMFKSNFGLQLVPYTWTLEANSSLYDVTRHQKG